jgi:hypothetical protein
MIKYLIAFLIFLNGCATKYEHLNPDLKVSRKDLLGTPRFSFYHQGSEYFFASDSFKQDGRDCYLYLGFKDDRLTFAFPSQAFQEIVKIYDETQNPEDIKQLIVQHLENHRELSRACYQWGSGPPPDAGQGIGIAMLLFPIFVPYIAYVTTEDQITRHKIMRISRELRLGTEKKGLPDFILKSISPRRQGKYDYFEHEDGKLSTILYFENDRLSAWSQVLSQ